MGHPFANFLCPVLPVPARHRLGVFRSRRGPARLAETRWDISSLPPILRRGGGSDDGWVVAAEANSRPVRRRLTITVSLYQGTIRARASNASKTSSWLFGRASATSRSAASIASFFSFRFGGLRSDPFDCFFERIRRPAVAPLTSG